MFCELFAVNSSEWIIGPQPLNAVLARTMPVDSVTTPKVLLTVFSIAITRAMHYPSGGLMEMLMIFEIVSKDE